jgi:hypothetical protein
MKIFTKIKENQKILFYFISTILVLSYKSLNFTVKSQALYFIAIFMVIYFIGFFISNLKRAKFTCYENDKEEEVLGPKRFFEVFLYITSHITSLRLKKLFSLVLSILYSLLVYLLIVSNGGFGKSTSKLLTSSLPLVLLFFASLDSKLRNNKAVVYTLVSLLIFSVVLFSFFTHIYFVLDMLLFSVIMWICFSTFVFSRQLIYLSAALFISAIPFLLTFVNSDYADFSANCAFMLLCIGVFKDLFYDFIFVKQ